MFLYGATACSAVSALSDSTPESIHVFQLPFKDDGLSILYFDILLENTEIEFKKEPDFGNREIIRGVLPTGRNKSENMCFALDRPEGILYLDENRNLDITDDISGVYRGNELNRVISFRDIQFEFTHGATAVRYSVDISFFLYDNKSCTMIVRSGWQGTVVLDGKQWTLTISDNLDGVIGPDDMYLLTPFREPEKQQIDVFFFKRNITKSQNNTLYKMPVPYSLFLDGHQYDLDFRFESFEKGGGLTAVFTETTPPAGTLILDGTNISRLVLETSEPESLAAVVLDSPGTTVTIPARSYVVKNVFIDSGNNSLGLFYSSPMLPVKVTVDNPAHLPIGSPLIHTAEVKRFGSTLAMTYCIKGAGGELYDQTKRDNLSAPKFTVYHNNRKIASGSFRYG
ncbi:hypothetical protein LLG96_00075 [bacterium]|nr:hypothetical protein [bacterium]